MTLDHQRAVLSQALSQFGQIAKSLPRIKNAFIATAVLQKSLRRADRAYACSAATDLLAIDPSRFWRRLVVIACEDFGLSDLTLTAQIIAAASDKTWRKSVGGDLIVGSYLVNCLLDKPRDRRVDEAYMLGVVLSRTDNAELAIDGLGTSSDLKELLRQAVALVLHCERVVPYRGIRAVIASECDVAIARMASKGWADRGLEEACIQARRTTQCLLPVLLPLLKAATDEAGGQFSIEKRLTPEVQDIEGLPSYSLDGFTRPGRAALMTLARQDRRLASLLAPLPTAKARMDALTNLLFVVEGGVCTSELSDPLYEELKSYSQGCWAGLSKRALTDGLTIMADALPALNGIRSELVSATILRT
jgi:hypothetical protein